MAKKDKKIYFDEEPTKGRYRLILNDFGKETVENLAGMMCTDEEIASILGVSVDTLVNENNKAAFSEYKKRGQSKGRASLRRMQYDAAKKGNSSMLIWLGKQYLDQKEQQAMTFDDANITFEIKPASGRQEEE